MVDKNELQSVMEQLTSHSLMKGLLSLSLLAFSWLFNDNYTGLIVVFVLIILDTGTGFIKAAKAKEVSSAGFYNFATKLLVYFILIMVGRLVDKTVPVHFASSIVETFLAATEAISIMENLGQLGAPIPKRLLDILKVLQKTQTVEQEDKKE